MNQFKSLLVILIVFNSSIKLHAQEDTAPGRIPLYSVPYKLPTVDGIKDVLIRVKGYYEATSTQTIIDAKTGKIITDFSKSNKNARVSSGFSSSWDYTHGVVLSAFSYIYDVTGDKRFFDDNVKFFDFVSNNMGYFTKNGDQFGKEASGWPAIYDTHALDDCGAIGTAMIKTFLKTKNEKYLPLIKHADDYISNKQFRLADGTLARHRPQYESVWADDVYMGVPFLTNMGVLTKDPKYFDDAAKQIVQIAARLYDPQKEIFDHGWNANTADYDPHFYWGRANGWIMMSMVELLSVLPENHPQRAKILDLFRSETRSLANLQGGNGFWHNLLDKTDSFDETSCTAMFTYAIARGINEGWISHTYGPVVLTGWNAINSKVLQNGAVDGTAEGTTFASDNTYYYNRGRSIYATHGYGPVLYAGAEMIRLLQNDKITIDNVKDNSINSTFHFKLKSEWTKK
ncbi:glycoside hydrolase family 105 protein [Flavobacterium alvei]|uniref:glycoside hydrolase family 88/105 protein n=1 Tax=Flavobacterium alvei TaxID=2080416 RepID=UPI0026F23ADE|nr:glycoside hydrolase family 88 protein [Flavobacterium alvei]